MSNSKTSLLALRKALNQQYMERTDLIDGMLASLVSGHPLFMVGAPGTAKSAICQSICSAIQGDFFSWMLTKFTVPEELFGPLSLKALEQDKYHRVTKSKLPDCHICFLDEIGKASSSISNTLLTILNEKTYYNGDKPQQVPMLTLFGASNEVPSQEELSAFYDRFVLRYNVEALGNEANIRALLTGINKVTMPKVSVADVTTLRQESLNVVIPVEVIDAMVQIKREVANEGILVSDRKWRQSIDVIRAYSRVQDKPQVDMEDLEILANILWTLPEQISKVRKIVGRISNPAGEKLMTIMDSARDIQSNLNNKKGDALEYFKNTKHMIDQLGKLGDPKKNAKLAQAIEFVKGIRQEIAKVHLNLE